MDKFMNPQRGRPQGLRSEEKEQGWRFVESALINRHAPQVGSSAWIGKCPSCEKQIVSHIETETYSKTHFCAGALIMSIVCCPMVCLVYLLDRWKKKHHSCPLCKMYLGTYAG